MRDQYKQLACEREGEEDDDGRVDGSEEGEEDEGGKEDDDCEGSEVECGVEGAGVGEGR